MSYWTKSFERIHCNTFHKNLPSAKQEYDIVIIGSGLMGISLSWFLATNDKKLSILIIDKNSEFASGATGMNGGHLWPSIMDSPYSLLHDRLFTIFGSLDKAIKQLEFIYNLGDDSYDDLIQLIQQDESFDLNIHNGKGLYIATNKKAMSQLECDVSLLRDTLKLSRIPRLLSKTEIENLGIKHSNIVGGSLEERACQISPVKLAHMILSKAQQYNNHISLLLNASVVKVLEHENSIIEIQTDCNDYITCNNIFYCTNDYNSCDSILPKWINSKLKTVTGHLISIPYYHNSDKFPCGIITSDLFYSVYLPKDQTYVIGHHITDNSRCNHICWTRYMKMLGINSNQIIHEWIGTTGTSIDNLPIVGLLPGSNSKLDCENII